MGWCATRRPQREKFDRRIETFELVLAHRARPDSVKQASKAAGDQQLLASARARCFYPADEVDVGTDQREIEPRSRPNVAVAHRAVMQGYPGAQLGIRCREPVQPVESLLCGTESGGATSGGCRAMEEREYGVAHEFEDLAASNGDCRDYAIKIGIQQLKHLVSGKPVRYRRKIPQVAQQQGRLQRLGLAAPDLSGKNV